jgi:ABC-2 type transport system ATP-binding protein
MANHFSRLLPHRSRSAAQLIETAPRAATADASRSPEASAESSAVRVRGLRKSYAGAAAVAGIDLDIHRGEIFALLGPNGAGKTTTVEILEGYRVKDAGDVTVLGCDPRRDRTQLKPKMGIVLQSTGVEQYLTVHETVNMYAHFFPHPRSVDDVIELVGLTGKNHERVIHLSGGQQRRLDMAIALAGDPELLFLDEPTTGFDPSARHEAWAIIKNLASLGKTIILTTHYMDEAEYLADRVAVIVGGSIVAEGPPSTLGFRDRQLARIRFRLPATANAPEGLGGIQRPDGFSELSVDDVVTTLHNLTGWALDQGVRLDGLEVLRPSLEDIYLSLTGNGAAKDAPSSDAEEAGKLT